MLTRRKPCRVRGIIAVNVPHCAMALVSAEARWCPINAQDSDPGRSGEGGAAGLDVELVLLDPAQQRTVTDAQVGGCLCPIEAGCLQRLEQGLPFRFFRGFGH